MGFISWFNNTRVTHNLSSICKERQGQSPRPVTTYLSSRPVTRLKEAKTPFDKSLVGCGTVAIKRTPSFLKLKWSPSNTYEHPAVLLKYADYLGTIHGFAPK